MSASIGPREALARVNRWDDCLGHRVPADTPRTWIHRTERVARFARLRWKLARALGWHR